MWLGRSDARPRRKWPQKHFVHKLQAVSQNHETGSRCQTCPGDLQTGLAVHEPPVLFAAPSFRSVYSSLFADQEANVVFSWFLLVLKRKRARLNVSFMCSFELQLSFYLFLIDFVWFWGFVPSSPPFEGLLKGALKLTQAEGAGSKPRRSHSCAVAERVKQTHERQRQVQAAEYFLGWS